MKAKRYILPVVSLLITHVVFSQSQVCPLNSNWSSGTITHWQAYTGNNVNGNGPSAIKMVYDSTVVAPLGTLGANLIYEYTKQDTPAIKVILAPYDDIYGGFSTLPIINGYQYTNSIRLGSTIVAESVGVSGAVTSGGYVRGLSCRFTVPPGPLTVPYTITYAYALVMENGSHPANQEPLFTVTLIAGDSVVSCASPSYFVPTTPNLQLDTPLAKSEGYYISAVISPTVTILCKNWTEVSIDLSPYRGQQVSLTFETDNCVPGGHFAYSYIAMRNTCAGSVNPALVINGSPVACTDNIITYSVPDLTGTSFQWTVPPGWTVVSGDGSNAIQVKPGPAQGVIIAQEESQGCVKLQDTLSVMTAPPTVAGTISGGAEVCAGMNAVTLVSGGNQGSVINWLASTDGVTYTPLNATGPAYTAQNLSATTMYRALVRNGPSCATDTSAGATVVVDPQSIGGTLAPAGITKCAGQNPDSLVQLSGQSGSPVNWQSSPDGINWADFVPADTATAYSLNGVTVTTHFRVIVQSGICPEVTSSPVDVIYIDTPFPSAAIDPADTVICYGTPVNLKALIGTGTNYSWTNSGTLSGEGNGKIGGLPAQLDAIAKPKTSTEYVLSIENAGCPGILMDTFRVQVSPPIIVAAGDDTSVVIGEPLPLNATVAYTAAGGGFGFSWTPITGLSNPDIPNPVAVFASGGDSVRYFVTATAPGGCTGVGSLLVKVFGTGPDIFVPNAFTPGGGSNNIFRPVGVGISGLSFFRIYNRQGQLVYSTSAIGQGWDGRIEGHLAESGAYVWMVQGTTYAGHIVIHKGMMMLIR